MKAFIHEDFLLTSPTARRLYHTYAEPMPILDYHCHLSPGEIASDRRWENMTQLWLEGDHYKWRQMRSNGVEERYCTGDASDYDKFLKYAESMEYLLRNPLFDWSHLELARYFGEYGRLSRQTAAEIWEKCNAMLQRPEYSARGLMRRSNVRVVCTTDDPTDDLRHHRQL
ncbi:MAG: glucuronate isomerase, partial [Bacteroidales bacterium]|nr:glucuronate isomerase [Bacteroidales bacterium]